MLIPLPVSIACTAALASACVGDVEQLATEARSLSDGDETHGDPAVALISRYDDTESLGFCTGFVIGPREVLTAAHCVLDRPAEYSVYLGADYPEPDAHYLFDAEVVEARVAGDFERATALDIALLTLAADAPVVPLRLATTPPEALVDTPVRLVGWGDSLRGPSPQKRTQPSVANYDATEGAVVIADPTGSAPCAGDSGGPALAAAGADEVVIGLASSTRGFGLCGSTIDALYVTAAAQRDFLERAPDLPNILAADGPGGGGCQVADASGRPTWAIALFFGALAAAMRRRWYAALAVVIVLGCNGDPSEEAGTLALSWSLTGHAGPIDCVDAGGGEIEITLRPAGDLAGVAFAFPCSDGSGTTEPLSVGDYEYIVRLRTDGTGQTLARTDVRTVSVAGAGESRDLGVHELYVQLPGNLSFRVDFGAEGGVPCDAVERQWVELRRFGRRHCLTGHALAVDDATVGQLADVCVESIPCVGHDVRQTLMGVPAGTYDLWVFGSHPDGGRFPCYTVMSQPDVEGDLDLGTLVVPLRTSESLCEDVVPPDLP